MILGERAMRRQAALVLFALFGACHVEKAPETVNALARHFWRHFDDADAAMLNEAIDNLHAAVEGDALKPGAHKEGKIDALLLEDIAGLPIEPTPEIKKARGFFVLTHMKCTLEQAERVTYSTKQAALHPGVYDSYERTFASDFDTYRSRAEPTLIWNTHFRATILGASYTADSHSDMRFVAPSKATTDRAFVVTRTFQPRPANFPGDAALDQDYEIEVLYPTADGTTMHFFGIWRDIYIGAFSIQDEITLAVAVNELVKWDARSSETCQLGLVDSD